MEYSVKCVIYKVRKIALSVWVFYLFFHQFYIISQILSIIFSCLKRLIPNNIVLFKFYTSHFFFVIKFKIWYSFVVFVYQSILVLKHNSMPFLLIFISFLILSILINKCLRWYITVRQLFYCVRFQQIYVFDLKWNRRVCMCAQISMLFQFWSGFTNFRWQLFDSLVLIIVLKFSWPS